MGSSLRTREAIELGENENRRLLEIIEAGVNAGWHSFEQSLLQAYESDFITEETAMLACVNKPVMRQRLDMARVRHSRTVTSLSASPMMVVAAAVLTEPAQVVPPIPAAAPKPEPHPGRLKGMLNGFI